jgi:hypothetical protein
VVSCAFEKFKPGSNNVGVLGVDEYVGDTVPKDVVDVVGTQTGVVDVELADVAILVG